MFLGSFILYRNSKDRQEEDNKEAAGALTATVTATATAATAVAAAVVPPIAVVAAGEEKDCFGIYLYSSCSYLSKK